ncbi:hypothetical protein CH63R_07986 [Colletotrichum higginsianum IMI 349063]|uniref:Uncharacterized protein n=1 Tax=Colletotrichum higginsianum (strain IMI 349063) TaxID=759273 RepID=A0A1B7YAU4_COLHI|nr:hypothetical protein CH63R_07986 [Colletotrichum higginsianum IMI 349063]OBR09221.1 hypothetical protein CH63R_07986 [Colletotrichum higginsianum IMI 349063]
MKTFRLKSSLDEDLVKECGNKVRALQTQKRCSVRKWLTFTDEEYEPFSDTAFVIVDMRTSEDCAVRIYTSDFQHKITIGIENKGYAVIVPWEPGLNILCNASCRIGEVIATEGNSP